MTTHVFVDESKRSDYLLAAAALSSTHARTARGLVRGLLLAGQRRVHMVKERPARQRTILSTLSASGARVVIYRAARGTRPRSRPRPAPRCLERLVADHSGADDTHLVIELDETLLARDRSVLYATSRREGCADRLRYRHERASTEPLLSVPDAVAWAWSQGGDWRRRTNGVVAAVIDV
ncbi:hypothetical protein [Cellulomonas sp. NPDC058312]|uniref:hypothetical protein n=1 Tax=Cellulomonas sp. NPDC058312 TaxID=3346441 RepID=UPI0036E243E6